VGGVILFVSAMCYVGTVVATMLTSPEGARQPVEYAEPMSTQPAPPLWDRFGFWTVVAVVVIAIAYAQPLYHLHTMAWYGSRGFSPF
jgi:hypothetical protein